MYRLPQQGAWKQSNRSSKFGDLWSSFNLDPTTILGSLRTTRRMLLNLNNSDDSSLGVASAFQQFTTTGATPYYHWAIAGSHLWHADVNGIFEKETAAGSAPVGGNADQSDLEMFNGYMYVSNNATASYKLATDGTWSSVASTFSTAAGLHMMRYFRATNRLYYVDDTNRSIGSLNTADTIAALGAANTLQTVVNGVDAIISWIGVNSTRIFIATSNYGASDNSCKVYAWDGVTATGPNEVYTVPSTGVYAGVIKDDVPVIMTANGQLMQLNGGTFTELDRLPLDGKAPPTASSTPTSRFIHFNGMTLVDGRINIFVKSPANTIFERFPSGVWEYTSETGLYHKSAVTLAKASGSLSDYGQNNISTCGAIFYDAQLSTKLYCGCTYFTTATVTAKGLFYEDTTEAVFDKYCYFVTPKLFSQEIEETWEKIYVRMRSLVSSTDRLIVKYRTNEYRFAVEATITWTSATTFTCTYATISNYIVGDEVEGTQGGGSGRTAHITSLVNNGGTATVTLNETLGASSGTAKARFQKWTKAGIFTTQNLTLADFPIIYSSSGWIQIKVCLLTTSDDSDAQNEIYDILLTNNKKR